MELWNLVDLCQRNSVQPRFDKYTPDRLQECIELILTKLDIYKDDEAVSLQGEISIDADTIASHHNERDYFLAQALANIDVFCFPDPDNPPRIKDYKVSIETTDEVPVRARPRKYSLLQQAFLEAKTGMMLRQKKLQPSNSDWSHGLVLVPYHDRIQKFLDKWGDTAHLEIFKKVNWPEVATFFRMCSDVRSLNQKTKVDIFPLPRIDDLLDSIPVGTDRFSAGDIADAFFCVELDADSRFKTAFRTHNAHLQYTVMLQGWVNAPSHFSRVIAQTFEDMDRFQVSAYLDDVLNHTGGFRAHFLTQQSIYDRLRNRHLTFKIEKTHINYRELRFLGHILSRNGRCPDPKKVEAITNLADPEDVTAVRCFLGSTSFYRQYIPQYADVALPLYDLTKKNVNVKKLWRPEIHGHAMERLKEALRKAPVLRYIDNSKPFVIHLDASKTKRGIGGVLMQHDDAGQLHPVEYFSRKLTPAERNYSATDLECKSLRDVILHWHIYLSSGRKFEVHSDHNCLKYMVHSVTATLNPRLLGYLMDLQSYRFALHYKKGVENVVADMLSRLWQIGDVPPATREELSDHLGPVVDNEDPDLIRSWGAAKRQLSKLKRQAVVEAQTIKKTHTCSSKFEVQICNCDALDLDLLSSLTNVKKGGVLGESSELENSEVRFKVAGSILKRRKQPSIDVEQYSCQVENLLKELNITEVQETGESRMKFSNSGQNIQHATAHSNRTSFHPSRTNYMDNPDESEDMKLIRERRISGYNQCTILPSTKLKAGWGLFATKQICPNVEICDYVGPVVSEGVDQLSSNYGMQMIAGAHRKIVIDGWEPGSSLGRYANDGISKQLINAKLIWKKSKGVLMALREILPGDEIFFDYGKEFWSTRSDQLSSEDNQILNLDGSRRKTTVSFKDEFELIVYDQKRKVQEKLYSKVFKYSDEENSRIQELVEMEERNTRNFERTLRYLETDALEKYSYENLVQCQSLADELQYLVGRKYIDDDNFQKYEIASIHYDETHKLVVGHRRPLSGKLDRYDTHPFAVCGESGLWELSDQYLLDHPEEDPEIKWPSSRESMFQIQENDTQLGLIISQLSNFETGHELEVDGHVYKLHENADEPSHKTLLRKHVQKNKGSIDWQIMVPQVLRFQLMKYFHEGYTHPGTQRMLETLKLRYFWPSIRKDVQKHVEECIPCKLRKTYQTRPKIPIMKYPDAKFPLSRIHIDLTGRLVKTKSGFSYILVVKDFLTKFVWLMPLKNKTPLEVANALITHVFCPFGLPELLVSDKGTEFVNKLTKAISKLFKYRRINTTPYTPRSQGLVENHNKTLKDQLYHFVGVLQDDWDTFLPTVQLMYNTTVSSSTSFTPYYMMFGRECRLPSIEFTLSSKLSELRLQPGTIEAEWIDNLLISLEQAWNYATKKAQKNHLRHNMVSRRPREFKEYNAGDLFFRIRRPINVFKSADDEELYKINAKLQARFEGPYKVIRRLSPILYDAEIEGKEVRINATNMKPF